MRPYRNNTLTPVTQTGRSFSMNAYEYAQSIGLTGTDAEIVAQLKGVKRHRRNVYITGGPSDTSSVNLLEAV